MGRGYRLSDWVYWDVDQALINSSIDSSSICWWHIIYLYLLGRFEDLEYRWEQVMCQVWSLQKRACIPIELFNQNQRVQYWKYLWCKRILMVWWIRSFCSKVFIINGRLFNQSWFIDPWYQSSWAYWLDCYLWESL